MSYTHGQNVHVSRETCTERTYGYKFFVTLAKNHDLGVLGFKGSSLNIYKVLIVVIIRAVEKWITIKIPDQKLKIMLF